MPCNPGDFVKERLEMVAYQLVRRDLKDEAVLDAMRKIPRHCFVPEALRENAYEDCPLPIGLHQTISQPYMVGLMSSLMLPNPTAKVLEIGTGSGYQAAVLAHLFQQVFTIELHEDLASQAEKVFLELGYHNLKVKVGDGSSGWQEYAPYHAIVVTAASPKPPLILLEQLEENGRLVIPVGGNHGQILQIWTSIKGEYSCTNSIPVSFVPLRGQYGWSKNDWQWYDS